MNKDSNLIYEAYIAEVSAVHGPVPQVVNAAEDKHSSKIDKLQLALDVVGFEPTVGTVADGANAIISALRSGAAIARKDNDKAKEHAINAGISAVSLIPFADVVKLAKARKLRKPALAAAKHIKGAGKAAKVARAAASADKLHGQVQHDGPPPGSTPATGVTVDV